MKTPYDAALRLRQREIDAMRISITLEVDQIVTLDGHRDAIDTSVRTEMEIAGSQFAFPAHAFVARMRAEREMLCRERAASNERLDTLRAHAIDAYGSLSALDSAAGRHRAEIQRTAAIAEQGQIDDFSAARFTRGLHAARLLRQSQGHCA